MKKEIKRSTVCGEDLCNGCMACVDKCPKDAITIVDSLASYNAVIDADKCIHCDLCKKVCTRCTPIEAKPPILWKQGWASDESIRCNGSSGGLASALSYTFIQNGGAVCSCVLRDGEFVFDIATSIEKIQDFAGSKYVKSNPKGIYRKIQETLQKGKKLLFIGLPCQSAAVQQYVGKNDLLYTVDLICHGTPSPRMLSSFLKESGYPIAQAKNVQFRDKADFCVSCDGKRIAPKNVLDRYTLSFLKGIDYTENCYSCDYAKTERVSDLTLGDSWGNQLSKEEQEKGVSLIVCQTQKGKELLDLAPLQLMDVDVAVALENNKQLSMPSAIPTERTLFLKAVKKKKRFRVAVAKAYPKYCLRQDVKARLIRLGLVKI